MKKKVANILSGIIIILIINVLIILYSYFFTNSFLSTMEKITIEFPYAVLFFGFIYLIMGIMSFWFSFILDKNFLKTLSGVIGFPILCAGFFFVQMFLWRVYFVEMQSIVNFLLAYNLYFVTNILVLTLVVLFLEKKKIT